MRWEKEANLQRIENFLGSLADLVSGSTDAGTPVVLPKNFIL
ncbi:MAG: coenzyme F420-0:L-glutamate ligase [Candidatus Thermoplasmatota archaeon]|nr:coenzyme F420-0:L-glutamate ligase [Candidatus Thermoplasmatota archaeon]MBS3790498.1 coenzyme F420-0:L-glutamate ligase [Candidatus Thermoplasmatota archaeon]